MFGKDNFHLWRGFCCSIVFKLNFVLCLIKVLLVADNNIGISDLLIEGEMVSVVAVSQMSGVYQSNNFFNRQHVKIVLGG